MGIFKVNMEVGDPQGENFQEVELLVDTGSTFTALPATLLRNLDVPVQESAQAELANGVVETVQVGETRVRLEGRAFTTPVIFAEEGEPSLLGAVTLEQARLAVDPVRGRLVQVNLLRM